VIDIEQIQRQIEKIYQTEKQTMEMVDIPPEIVVNQWVSFAEEYIAAASIVEKADSQHYLAILQMTGQAMESSLKACLLAADKKLPKHHDLVELCKLAVKLDFQLSEHDIAAIMHLHHFYFKDWASGTMYKARYPISKIESLGGVVPSNATFASIIHSLIEQARHRPKQR